MMGEVSLVSNFLLDFIHILKRFKNNGYYVVCCQTYCQVVEEQY